MPLYDNEYKTTKAYGIDIVNNIRCRDDKTLICMCMVCISIDRY